MKFFFYVDYLSPDFSKGYAVARETGKVYVWDLGR